MTLPHYTTGRVAPVALCPDILLEIFNHLQPERRQPNDERAVRKQRRLCRQALRACALTCRGLSDLALDVLWRALDDIRPIVKLLSASASNRRLVLNPQIEHEAWLKCQRYATRVRDIGLYRDPEQMHQSAWTFLAIKCEGSPLLPRLRHLDAYGLALDKLSPLFLLLTPSLRSLSLSFVNDRGKDGSSDSQVSVYVLQHIARVAPSIKTCLISGSHCFTTQTHLSTLQNFAGLTELSLDSYKYGFDGAMFCHLGEMTSLDALDVTITNLDQRCLQPLRDEFPLLHRLKLKGRLDHLVTLVLACRLPVLRALTLEVKDRSAPKNLTHALAPLSQHLDLVKSLTHIRLDLVRGTVSQQVQILARYLEPLLSFSKLEHCDLDFGNAPPSICDNDLIRLGDAWPNLEHLNVRGRTKAHHDNTYSQYPRHQGTYARHQGGYARHQGAHAPPNSTPEILHPSVFGLTALARRCPTLRYVHLVTLDGNPSQETFPRGGAASRAQAAPVPHTSLRELLFESVDKAVITGCRCELVEELDAAFPGLDVSRSKAECAYPDVRPEWRRIMLLLRALRYRRDPENLGPNPHRRAAAAAQFAASRRSLASVDEALSDAERGDSDREWDFDSDDDDEDRDGGLEQSDSESSRDWDSDS